MSTVDLVVIIIFRMHSYCIFAYVRGINNYCTREQIIMATFRHIDKKRLWAGHFPI